MLDKATWCQSNTWSQLILRIDFLKGRLTGVGSKQLRRRWVTPSELYWCLRWINLGFYCPFSFGHRSGVDFRERIAYFFCVIGNFKIAAWQQFRFVKKAPTMCGSG